MTPDEALYRVTEGNGQVSCQYGSKRAAIAQLKLSLVTNASARLQRYFPGTADEPGDWFRVQP
jgi:hypothetical protein